MLTPYLPSPFNASSRRYVLMATEINCLPVCAPAPTDTLPVNPPTAVPPDGSGSVVIPDEIDQYDTSPVQVCFEGVGGAINHYWAYDRVRFNNRTSVEVSRVRHWFNPLTGVDTTDAPVGTPAACESTLPVQVLRDIEQLGCVFDVNGNVTGRVFLSETSEGGVPSGYEMMLVATDGTITRPYTGSWSNCAPSNDFVQVVESEEPGCAAGTPWTRRQLSFFNRDGLLVSTSTDFVDSAGNVELDAPDGFLLGDCAAPAQTELLYTTAMPICVEEPAGVFSLWYTRRRITFNGVSEVEVGANEFSVDGVNWEEGTPVGIVRAGVCPPEAAASGSANVVAACGDLGLPAWQGNSAFANTSFDKSIAGQTSQGPGWFTTMAITAAPGGAVSQNQLGVVAIEPGEIALRAGATAVDQTIVGWRDVDLELNQIYSLSFRLNLSGDPGNSPTMQWFVDGVAFGDPIGVTAGTQQFDVAYTHELPTGPYDVELRWTSNDAGLMHSLDGVMFRRTIAEQPAALTTVEYSDTVKAVVDQILNTAGCNDHVRDGLLKEILDVLGSSVPTAAPATIARARAVANGSVAANKQSATFTNVGTTDATVLGAALAAGETVTFTAYMDPVTNTYRRLPIIPYTASATSALSIATMD